MTNEEHHLSDLGEVTKQLTLVTDILRRMGIHLVIKEAQCSSRGNKTEDSDAWRVGSVGG
jgi:predicted Zn-ribbon and HTH transcriptional regulator